MNRFRKSAQSSTAQALGTRGLGTRGVPTRGFTLVELLVVIVIVGILLGILLAALGPTRITAQNFAITQEINQLDGAVEAFKTKFGFYPPSNLGDLSNAANPEFGAFRSYLRKIAPNHQETDNQIIAWWNQVGQYLDNDAILVFWLSGVNKSAQYPLTYNLGGDNTYETGDDVFTGFAVGEDPYKYVFFDFKSNRLVDGNSPTVKRFMQESIGEQPYVFFSSKNYLNDGYVSPLSGEAVVPYRILQSPELPYPPPAPNDNNASFYNPEKFQIVAAGVDRRFGNLVNMPAGQEFVWTKLEASAGAKDIFPFARNNITNFTQGILEKLTQ